MEPEVLYLCLCDEVRTDPENFLRVDVLGLITHIRSTTRPPFPVVRPLVCVLVILTGCRGVGELSLRIVQASTGRVIFRNQPRPVRFAGVLEEAVGVVFRVRNCSFPEAGGILGGVYLLGCRDCSPTSFVDVEGGRSMSDETD
jgi:hypothetical protein